MKLLVNEFSEATFHVGVRALHGLGLGLSLVGLARVVVLWVGYGLLENNMGFIYFLNPKRCASASSYSATANVYTIRIHTLPYTYPRYYRHTLTVK